MLDDNDDDDYRADNNGDQITARSQRSDLDAYSVCLYKAVVPCWNKIILKNFRMFQCFILTWNHVWNEIKLFQIILYFNTEPRMKWNEIILAAHDGIFMRQLLQSITAFV